MPSSNQVTVQKALRHGLEPPVPEDHEEPCDDDARFDHEEEGEWGGVLNEPDSEDDDAAPISLKRSGGVDMAQVPQAIKPPV